MNTIVEGNYELGFIKHLVIKQFINEYKKY